MGYDASDRPLKRIVGVDLTDGYPADGDEDSRQGYLRREAVLSPVTIVSLLKSDGKHSRAVMDDIVSTYYQWLKEKPTSRYALQVDRDTTSQQTYTLTAPAGKAYIVVHAIHVNGTRSWTIKAKMSDGTQTWTIKTIPTLTASSFSAGEYYDAIGSGERMSISAIRNTIILPPGWSLTLYDVPYTAGDTIENVFVYSEVDMT